MDKDMYLRCSRMDFGGQIYLTIVICMFKNASNSKKLVISIKRDEIPLNGMLEVQPCDCWGTEFIDPFPPLNSHIYIFVCVNYVTKWVKAIACTPDDAHVLSNFLKNNFFAMFGFPRVLISDRGMHFYNKYLESVLAKYNLKHKVSIPYNKKTYG